MSESRRNPHTPKALSHTTETSLSVTTDPLLASVLKALPSIPDRIKSREGFNIATLEKIWRMPPALQTGPINWNRLNTTPAMRRLVMGYVAALLHGKSERFAASVFRKLTRIVDWKVITDPWEKSGEIGLQHILTAQRQLREKYQRAWRSYFRSIKGLYLWAEGKGVPGFTLHVCDHLNRIKLGHDLPFVKLLDVAPGAPRSMCTKNRMVYDEPTLAIIAAYLHKAEALVRKGHALYRSVADGETGAKEGVNDVIRRDDGQLLRPSTVGIRHLVLAWLAWRFGDRPDAFRKLRESHFEFFETDGEVVLAQLRLPEIRMPASKIRHTDYQAIQGPLPLGDDLARLVPKLIEKNRAIRARLGLDNDLDWPLFMVVQEGKGSHIRKRTALLHEDPCKAAEKSPMNLLHDLQILFQTLQIPDGNGGVIVPTFYSFRDAFVTNLLQRGVLPEVIAALHNKQVRSLAPYWKPGVRFVMDQLDQVPEFSRLAQCFQPAELIHMEEVEPEALVPFPPWVELEDGTKIGGTGRCGCVGSPCPIAMNGSVDCYTCPKFRGIVEAPHRQVHEALWARREALIKRGLPEQEYSRYDQNLAAIQVLIMKIQNMGAAQ